MKTTPTTHLIPVLAVALASLACGRGNPDQGPPPMPVKIQVAKGTAVDDTSEYVATLKSRGSAAIMPQVEGHVTRIFVRAGARVEEGAPLLQIDPAKQQATVTSQQETRAAKQAALQFARQQYERVEGLHAAGISSKAELDQAKSALDAAQGDLESVVAQVREQQTQLQYYRVTAPAAGGVGDIPVRVGDRVTTSTLLTTVNSPGLMEAYISVPVERAAQLQLGMPLRILDSTGQVVAESRITFIAPEVDAATQTVLATAGMQNKGTLRPDQFIRARVVWGTYQAPTVPVLAVSRLGGQYFAFVAEPDKGGLVARQRPIKVGPIVGNDYVVLGGIKEGDRILVSGTQFVRDGAPVTPQG